MYIHTVKQWHRFWQKDRKEINIVCLDSSLLDYPLFGKVFGRHEFFERVLKHFSGILILVEDNGYYVVSREYIAYVPKSVAQDLLQACENNQIDIQLLFDTLVKRFMKEV